MNELSLMELIPGEILVEQFTRLQLIALKCCSKELYQKIKNKEELVKKKSLWEEKIEIFQCNWKYQLFVKRMIPKSAVIRRKMLHSAASVPCLWGIQLLSDCIGNIDKKTQELIFENMTTFDEPLCADIMLQTSICDRETKLFEVAVKLKNKEMIEYLAQRKIAKRLKFESEIKLEKLSEKAKIYVLRNFSGYFLHAAINCFGDNADRAILFEQDFVGFYMYLIKEPITEIESFADYLDSIEPSEYFYGALISYSYVSFTKFKWILEEKLGGECDSIDEIIEKVWTTNEPELRLFSDYIQKKFPQVHHEFLEDFLSSVECGDNHLWFLETFCSQRDILIFAKQNPTEKITKWLFEKHPYLFEQLWLAKSNDFCFPRCKIEKFQDVQFILQLYEYCVPEKRGFFYTYCESASLPFLKAMSEKDPKIFGIKFLQKLTCSNDVFVSDWAIDLKRKLKNSNF